MFDRVVAVLVAAVLLLMGAANALACSECGLDTGQCLVSLELQAEEVLSTDLEALLQSIDTDDLCWSNANAECTEYEVLSQEAEAPVTKANGAAGVCAVSMDLRNDNLVTHQPSRLLVRSGRFTGATA